MANRLGLDEQFEAKVRKRTQELVAKNDRLTSRVESGIAALRLSRTAAKSGRAHLIASEISLSSARADNLLGRAHLKASEAALASARLQVESAASALLASAVALASSQSETVTGVAVLHASKGELAGSQAAVRSGKAELHASVIALASSQADLKFSHDELLLSNRDLASSRAEAVSWQTLLAASEHARSALAGNSIVQEGLITQRTSEVREEINTRRNIATAIAHEINQPLMAISGYLSSLAYLIERDLTRETRTAIAETARQAAAEAIRAGNMLKLLRNSITRDDTVATIEDIGLIIAETLEASALESAKFDITYRFDNLGLVDKA